MEKITIRAFRAVDDRERCVRYILELGRVLEDIGVTNVIRPDVSWVSDPDTIVFVAEHPTLGMIGGIRLQWAKQGVPLPMERSLDVIAPSLSEHLAPLIPGGNAELGALWNAHRFAGRGVPHLLIAAAVSMANQLSLRSMVCLVAEYVAPYCAKSGFKMMEEVGDRGQFVFPIPSIRSHAMRIPDVNVLDLASSPERQRLMSLRLRPEQTRVERPKREDLEVTYQLLKDKADPSYREIAIALLRHAA